MQLNDRKGVCDTAIAEYHKGRDMKIFVTGDNHFGRKFDKYAAIKDRLVESRYECLRDMVRMAEDEQCEFFVITGDLFDNNRTITKKVVKQVVDILATFDHNVLVLPGNHDFYSGNESLWNDFEEVADTYNNIIVMNQYAPYDFDTAEEKVVFYPAYCDSKHSDTNRLDWIKQSDIQTKGVINIGVAHGALEGLAIDTEGVYFPMSRTELQGIPVDAWLIGHAHVAEPNITSGQEVTGYTIFNAGTHEQLDLHNNTEGNAFVITIEDQEGMKRVLAKRVVTGKIHYYDKELILDSTNGKDLKESICEIVKDYPNDSIVRLTLKGSVEPDEYMNRGNIYEECLGRFLSYKWRDDELNEKITEDKIKQEFSEISFAAKFLENLIEEPVELQMAYDVVNSLRK